MMKPKELQALKALKQQLYRIYDQIDAIIQAGGHIDLGDPLTFKAQVIRTQINRLVRP